MNTGAIKIKRVIIDVIATNTMAKIIEKINLKIVNEKYNIVMIKIKLNTIPKIVLRFIFNPQFLYKEMVPLNTTKLSSYHLLTIS